MGWIIAGLVILLIVVAIALFGLFCLWVGITDREPNLFMLGVGLTFFGIVASLFCYNGWSRDIANYKDEQAHPCIEWSNPYVNGGLAKDSFCTKRKE